MFLLQIVKALEHLHSKLSVIHRGKRAWSDLALPFIKSISFTQTFLPPVGESGNKSGSRTEGFSFPE